MERCPRCGTEMVRGKTNMVLDKRGIVLYDLDCFKCKKCGEIIFLEEQAKDLQEKADEVEALKLRRKISYTGKQLVVCRGRY